MSGLRDQFLASVNARISGTMLRKPNPAAPPPVEEGDTPDPTPAPLTWNAIGQENEGIRHQFDALKRRIDDFTSIQHDFNGFFTDITAALKNYEAAKTALAEANYLVGMERSALDELKQDFSKADAERDKLRKEAAGLLVTLRETQKGREGNEAKIAHLTHALSERTGAFLDLDKRHRDREDRTVELQHEIEGIRAEAKREADANLGLGREMARLTDLVAVTQRENEALRMSVDEATQSAAALARKLAEREAAYATVQQRLEVVEDELAHGREEHEDVLAAYEAEVEEHRTEKSALTARIAAVTARAETLERLLNHAREQIQTKSDEIKKLDRTLIDTTIQLNSMEHKLTAANEERAGLRVRLDEIGEAMAKANADSSVAVRVARDKEAAYDEAERRAYALAEKIEEDKRRAEDDRKRLSARVRELLTVLETERAERAFIEGALETARAGRAKLEEELLVLKLGRPLHKMEAPAATAVAPIPAPATAANEEIRAPAPTAAPPATSDTSRERSSSTVGQVDAERRPRVVIIERDRAAVQADELGSDREAEAAAAASGRAAKGLEQAGPGVGRNAGPIVADENGDRGADPGRGHLQSRRPSGRAGLGKGLGGVAKKVEKDT